MKIYIASNIKDELKNNLIELAKKYGHEILTSHIGDNKEKNYDYTIYNITSSDLLIMHCIYYTKEYEYSDLQSHFELGVKVGQWESKISELESLRQDDPEILTLKDRKILEQDHPRVITIFEEGDIRPAGTTSPYSMMVVKNDEDSLTKMFDTLNEKGILNIK